MPGEPTIPIRSFRVCFQLERRIHKIDRWRIPLPFGVPVRGLAYAAAALVAVAMLSGMVVIGDILHTLPAPVRLVVLPVAAAYALTRWEIDGRPAHAVARSWVRLHTGRSRLSAFRPSVEPGRVTLGAVTVAPDEQGASLRPAVITGPVRIVLRYPFEAREGRRTLRIVPRPGPPRWQGTQITLRPGQRVVIR